MDSKHDTVAHLAGWCRALSVFTAHTFLCCVVLLTSTLAAQEWPIAAYRPAEPSFVMQRLPPVLPPMRETSWLRDWSSPQRSPRDASSLQTPWRDNTSNIQAADPFAGSLGLNSNTSPGWAEPQDVPEAPFFLFANTWFQPGPQMPLPPQAGSASAVESAVAASAPSGARLRTPRRPSGYIDNAVIGTRLRLRYDSFQNANAPTRGEYLYPTIGLYGGPGPGDLTTSTGGGGGGATSSGDQLTFPPFQEAEVDLQEVSVYTEFALNHRFSIFGEFPVRWASPVDPGLGPEQAGLQTGAGDFKTGIRYGIITSPDHWLTAQLRVHAPTGESLRALGIGHSAIDVALLYQQSISDRLTIFGEMQDWQSTSANRVSLNRYRRQGRNAQFPGGMGPPRFQFLDDSGLPTDTITAPDEAFEGRRLDGNVLRYGAGAGYDLWQSCSRDHEQRLTAVVEVVGWTVLHGLQTDISGQLPAVRVSPPDPSTPAFFPLVRLQPGIRDASGDTIVNGKYGLRYTTDRGSVYVGYGHNWTAARWYSDVVRIELTKNF